MNNQADVCGCGIAKIDCEYHKEDIKEYSKIEENEYRKVYLNEKNEYHRLTGPAIEWYEGDKSYYINNIWYMKFYIKYNELIIYTFILDLIPEYYKYIQQNIKNSVREYNAKIEFHSKIEEYGNELPDWLQELIK